jgi:hypothetical protein
VANINPNGGDRQVVNLSAEQTDMVRRLLFDDIAEQAGYVAKSAKVAADEIDNAMSIGDARTALRLMSESVDVLEQLGWGAAEA